MKQYILLLVLMVMGAGMTVHAEDVNPVKVGNVIIPGIFHSVEHEWQSVGTIYGGQCFVSI